MSRLHLAVPDQRFRRCLAIFLAGGLMVWAMLLMATEHRAAATAGLTGPVIHPAAESTPNALPRDMCVDSGNEHGGAWISPDVQGDDGDGFGDHAYAVVVRGWHAADDEPAGEGLVADSSPVTWTATPVYGSRAPPVSAWFLTT